MTTKYKVLGRAFDSYVDAEDFKDKVEALIVEVENLNLPYVFDSLKAPISISAFDPDFKLAPQVLPRSQWG